LEGQKRRRRTAYVVRIVRKRRSRYHGLALAASPYCPSHYHHRHYGERTWELLILGDKMGPLSRQDRL